MKVFQNKSVKLGLAAVVATAALTGSLSFYRQIHTTRSLSSVADDDVTQISGFPAYRLTPLKDEGEVKSFYNLLRTDLGFDIWDRCSDRAHVWSYQLQKAKNVNSGKVFIFFTNGRNVDASGKMIAKNRYSRSWTWHVAPYVVADNKEFVMERLPALPNEKLGTTVPALDQPLLLKDWVKLQANGADCVELKGTEKEISKFTCGEPKGDKCVAAKTIAVPANGPACYFRRTPMYYYYPSSVGNHDYLGKPELANWTGDSVYDACGFSLSGEGGMFDFAKDKRKKLPKIIKDRCTTFVSNPMTSFTSEWIAPSYGTIYNRSAESATGMARGNYGELPNLEGAEHGLAM